MRKILLSVGIILSLTSNAQVKIELSRMYFSNKSTVDYQILNRTYWAISEDSLTTISDIALWFEAKNKYLNSYSADTFYMWVQPDEIFTSRIPMAYCDALEVFSQFLYQEKAELKFEAKDYVGAIDDWKKTIRDNLAEHRV